jgi:hypothetical protein
MPVDAILTFDKKLSVEGAMLVTKIAAGEQQLNEAIRLFFRRGGPVATHTLAGAASQVLSDVAKHRGLQSLIRGNPFVREDMRDAWNSQMNQPQNFFKHADRDPEGTFEFNPAITTVFMLEAASLLEQLTGHMSWEARVFSIWFALKHPHLLLPGAYSDMIQRFSMRGLNVDDFEFMTMVLDQRPQ